MPSSLSDLHARLVQVELEAQIGATWFESWIELLKLEDGADNVPQALLELAKRMDTILSVSMNSTNTKDVGGSAAAEKRSFEQVETPTAGKEEEQILEVPAKKKPVDETPVAAEPVEVVEVAEPPAKVVETVEEPKSVAVEEAKPAVVEEVAEPAKAPEEPEAPEPQKPVSKLSAFLSVAEVPVTYSTTPAKSPAASSPKPASPSSPAQAKAPSSPSAVPKAPSSPSAVAKAPSSPSAVAKASTSPASAAPKAPLSPATIAKAPSSPSPAKPVEVVAQTVSPPSSPSVVAKPSEQPANAGQSEATKTMVKKSEGGHMEIPSDCEQLFNEIKIRKKHRYIILKIQDWQLQVTKVAPRTATFDDFLKDLPFSDCCYAVYDHERLKADQYGSRMAAKVFFITWQPVPAPTQLKMLYSTERRTLASVFKGIEDLVATKKDDVLVACGEKGKFDEDDSEDEERGGKGDWMDD